MYRPTLLRRQMESLPDSIWILIAFGTGQFLRLASNLALTRLLAPELFGAMAIVNTVLMGLVMLSDIGIRGKIINSPDAERSHYRNTAWSLQIAKGTTLFCIMLVIAPFVESYYGHEGLALLIAACSFSLLFSGAISIRYLLLTRNLQFKKVAIIDLTSQLLGISIMLICAYLFRSIWALVAGSLTIPLSKLILTHTCLPGGQDKLQWDKSVARDIFKYGKWVLLSTAVSFATLQGDKLIMGKLLSLTELGVYTIASMLSLLSIQVTQKMSSGYLHPLIAKNLNGKPNILLIAKKRAYVISLGVALSLILVFGGNLIIDLLYDARYKNAGWMLQLLAIAGVYYTFELTLQPFLLAKNQSRSMMAAQTIKGVTLIFSMITLGSHYGVVGFLVAIIIAPLSSFLIVAWQARKYGYNLWWIDPITMLVLTTLIFAVWQQTEPQAYTELIRVVT